MSSNNRISRRTLLAASSVGLAAAVLPASSKVQAQERPMPVKRANRLPREVWAATVSLERLEVNTPEEMIRRITARMEEILPYEPDIICLPEVFPFMMLSKRPPLSECAEDPPGPVTRTFTAFAKKNNCYIICPIYTKEDGKFYNAAVVIDRKGQVIGQYRKIRPTVGEIENGITPGPPKPPVFDTDFGRIGIQICFDVNWYEGWRQLSNAGAEIVFWPSAFVGGRMLNAMAWINKYPIVTSTRWDPTRIIDITGDDIAVSGHFQHWACGPINLEKVFIHLWPYVRVFPEVRAKYGRKVNITILNEEDWAVFESRDPDVKIHDVLKEFDIPTHKQHIQTAQQRQEQYWRKQS